MSTANTVHATSNVVKSLRSMLKSSNRKANQVINIPHFPYSQKRGLQHEWPEWRKTDEKKNHWYDFGAFDDIIVYKEKSTGKIVYGWVTYANSDGTKVTKKMRRYIQDMGLSIQKETMTPEDKYEVIGYDCENIRCYIDPVEPDEYGKFTTYGNQYTALFDEKDIEAFHPHNIYPPEMTIEEIQKLEQDREHLSSMYWSAWNIHEENLGMYPDIK